MIQMHRKWQEIKYYHVLIDTAWCLRALICWDTEEAFVLAYSAQGNIPDDKLPEYQLSDMTLGWHGMLEEDRVGRIVRGMRIGSINGVPLKVLNPRNVFDYKDF